MNFTTTQEQLDSALSLVSKTIKNTSGQSQNSGFGLFKGNFPGNPGEIQIIASDKISTISTKFFCRYEEPYEIGLPLEQLSKITSLLQGEINLSLKNNWAILKSGRSVHKLPVLKNLMFPEEPVFSDSIFIRGAIFHEAIRLANISVAKENQASWSLCCLNFKIKDNLIELFSCDGCQACRVQLKSNKSQTINRDFSISSESILPLLKFIKKDEDSLLYIDQSALKIENSKASLIIRLPNSKFPDINNLIPDKSKWYFSVKKSELELVLKRVTASMKRKTSVVCSLTESEVSLVIEEENAGRAERTLDLVQSNIVVELNNPVKPVELVINSQHILNLITNLRSDTKLLKIEFGEKFPIKITPDTIPVDFIYITMPVVENTGDIGER